MISFFTHSGGAGIIRGEQIAKHLGAKLNPKDGYEDDVCIYIKTFPFPFIPKHTYIDVVEDSAGLRWVKNYPEVGIIASSKSIYNYLSNKLPNKIVLILQHHCNFERVVRTRKEVGRKDGTFVRFDDNAGVVIDNQGLPRGTRILGPVAREVKEVGYNKIASLAREVV